MNAFDIAPAAVVRVAGWPLESIQRMSSSRLAEQAAAVDPGDEASLLAYEEAYQHVLEQQRQYLWRITAGDRRFRCALALSSPSLESRLKEEAAPARRNKRARHLEKSLYRYLARAVSRIEPHGLWIGVTLAEFCSDEHTQATPRPAKTHVAPELAPFRNLLRALGQREPYRTLGPYRLNPTLQMVDEQCWCYARCGTDGTLAWRDLPLSPVWKILQDELMSVPPASLTTLRRQFAELFSADIAGPMTDFALDSGLLIGGLQLPARFESPWDALEQAEALLKEPEAGAWRSVREHIKAVCEKLQRYLDAMLSDVDSEDSAATASEPVLWANAALREAIETLAQALSVPIPPMPHAMLRCDLAAPFRIQLGKKDRQGLASLLEDCGRFGQQSGAAKRHEGLTQRVLRASGDSRLMGVPQGQVSEFSNAGSAQQTGDPRGELDVAEPLAEAKISDERGGDADEVTISVHASAGVGMGPALEALVLRPGRDGFKNPWVRGFSSVATATHARHAYHLRNMGDPLLPWFRATFREIERTCGIGIVDLIYDHPGSPNVLARPSYTEAVIDPWGTTPGAFSCEGARLVQGPHAAAALLLAEQSRMAAHVFTAMAVPPTDVVVERLMATSFNWRTIAPPRDDSKAARETESEVRQRRRLSNGAILEPCRMALPEQDVRALSSATGAGRFRLWQRLSRSHRWPEFVRVTIGNAPALIIPTDSPLALEVAFEGVKGLLNGESGKRTRVMVEEVVEGPWLAGREGHHITELVLPVRRARHFWESPGMQFSANARNDESESLQELDEYCAG